MVRLIVDPEDPDPALVERAGELLARGELAIIPTDTLYGLAADPFNARAIHRVFAVKGRTTERALPLVASSLEQAAIWAGEFSPLAVRLANRFWPGPLTLVINASAKLVSEVTGGHGTVGVRVPAHAVPRALCAAVGRPLTATSANISGVAPTDDPNVAAAAFEGADVAVLVDGGRTRGGRPSTIVEVVGDEPRLIRAGAISWDEVRACAATV